jgi:hypothetical protein
MLFTNHTLYAIPIYHEELHGNIKTDTNRNVPLECVLHKVSKILQNDTGTLKYQYLKTETAYRPALLVQEISFPKGTPYLASLLYRPGKHFRGISFDCRNYVLIRTHSRADEHFVVDISIIIQLIIIIINNY